MSKFKVGDKVRVLDGSKIKDYTANWFALAMEKYVGQVHEICDVFTHYSNRTAYKLKDCGGYTFDERGLEPACKFKVGDKVIGNEHADDIYSVTGKGWVGIVTENDPKKCNTGDDIRVRAIDEPDGTNFSVESVYFDLYGEPTTQKIVITTDGKTTTSVLYDGKKRIKDAKAICAPTDTFDFNYGASLALDRLTGFVRGSVDCTLEENSDWDKFIGGEIVFEMTKDKYDAFLKEVEKRFPKLRWSGSEKPTDWKPSIEKCYFRVNDEANLCWGTNADIESIQWTPDGLDWNKFAHGELRVKVGKEKFDEFMKLCEEKNFRWANNKFATAINPWKLYDNMPHFLKTFVNLAGDMPHEHIWISVEDEVLKFGTKSDEDIDEYEFV